MSTIQGSLVALVTPMKPNGKVDFESLARLVDFHLEAGTHGIVAVGTTGESATLDHDEHCDVIAAIVRGVNGRIPVIAGTGSNSTREAIDLSLFALDAGADATLQVVPYYNKPTQHGLIAHFAAIAEAVDLPHILYNVPGRTSCDMLPAAVAELAKVPNIIGIKEATGKIDRCQEIMNLCGPDFAVYSGEDALSMDIMALGGKGTISVTANVAPKLMHDIFELALAGKIEEARELDQSLTLLHERLFVEANPIPVKWVLQQMKLIPGGIRLPLTPLSEKFHPALREAMSRAGLS